MSEKKDGAHLEQETPSLSAQTISISGVEVICVLGTGGMSTVYKGRQVAMDRIVAIKVLHKHLLSDSSYLVRFMREARLSKALEHPNIASLLSFGTTADEQPYLLLEYCEGETLKERMERQPALTWQEIRSILDQMCLALTHAHKHGVVHRDLKPSNVFVRLDEEGCIHVKLIDFGIAKLLAPDEGEEQKLTRTGMVVGTPYYMSPEQCMCSRVDTRADIYALGCMLYHLIAGQPPFDGESALEIAGKHVSADPPPIADVSKVRVSTRLWGVVTHAMAKKPEDRFQSAEEMRTAISEVGADAISIDKSGRKSRKPVKIWSFKKIAFTVTLAVIPCLVLAGLAYVNMNDHRSKLLDEAEALLDSGKYEDALQPLLAARHEQLSDADASRVLNDLSDLITILNIDRPPSDKVHLLKGSDDYANASAITLALRVTEPAENHPSKLALDRAQLAAASVNGSQVQAYHLDSIDLQGLSPEDTEYFQGMIESYLADRGFFKHQEKDGLTHYQRSTAHLRKANHPGALIKALLSEAESNKALGRDDRYDLLIQEACRQLPAALNSSDRETARGLMLIIPFLMNDGKLAEAQQALDQAGAIYEHKMGGAADMGTYYRKMAELMVRKRQYAQASARFGQALGQELRNYGTPAEYCDILEERAVCWQMMQEESKARQCWQDALWHSKELPNKDQRLEHIVSASLGLAASWRQAGDVARADQILQKVIPRMQQLFADKVSSQLDAPSSQQAAALHSLAYKLAQSLADLHQVDEARAVMQRELQVLLKTEEPCRTIVDCYINMSYFQPSQAQVIHCVEKAVTVQSEFSRTLLELHTLNDLRAYLGMLYETNGRPQEALPLLEQVERYCASSKLERINSELFASYGLANVYYKLGRQKEALGIYQNHIPKLKPKQYQNNPEVRLARTNYQDLLGKSVPR